MLPLLFSTGVAILTFPFSSSPRPLQEKLDLLQEEEEEEEGKMLCRRLRRQQGRK